MNFSISFILTFTKNENFSKEQVNKQRFINYLLRHDYMDRTEDFEKITKVLSAETRMILEERWGYEDGRYCPNFRQLGSKMGISAGRAQEDYRMAKRELMKAKYIIAISDHADFDSHMSYLVGRLVYDYTYLTHDKVEEGKYLLSIVYGGKLTEREKRVLVLKYGLEDGKFKTNNEVSQIMENDRERVRQIRSKAFRKIKYLIYKERHK